MSKPIVCGVDFTDASERALDEAVDLAARLGAPVDVLHVYSVPTWVLPEGAVIPSAEDAARIAQHAQELVDALIRARTARGVPLRSVLKSGAPWEELCRHGEEVDALLVVVGTHSRGILRRALLGSVASKVIRICTRPVLTVPTRRVESRG